MPAAEAFAKVARLAQTGRTAEAESLFQATLAAYPDHPYSLLMQGILAHRSGNDERATELLTRAAARGDQDADFHNNLGNALVEVGRADAARGQFERALALKPDSAEILYNLGNALTLIRDFASAVTAFERAVALKPGYADAHVSLGNLLASLGRAEEALAHFREAVAIQPNSDEAHNNLGFVLSDLGRTDEAIAEFERAITINPRLAHAHNNLGNAYLAQGSETKALACYQAALKLDPAYVKAINNMGTALCRLGRCDEAKTHLERGLVLAPQSAEINNGLGNALQKLGLWEESLACYERAIALSPDYADAWTNLAAAYNDRGLHEKAVTCCDRALAIDPRSTEALTNRGVALVALDRLDQAIDSYRQALAIDSRLADVHGNIGSALVERGRMDEAIEHFDRAIALEPRRPKFLLCHVLTKRVTAGDPRLAALEALARDEAGLTDEARIDLHFALGKAYGDIGRHDNAFAALVTGNAVKRKSLNYDEAATLNRLDGFARAWPRPVIESRSGAGNPSHLPIFILGMPRTGSTLVEQILASHPAVAAGGELNIFQSDAIAVLGPLERFRPAEIAAERRAALIGAIADRYLAALGVFAPGVSRITDKTPGNFAFVGLIHLAFPNARIIHTRRNALDTCLSCFSSLFTGVQFSYDLGEIGRYYRAYDRLMRHWRTVMPATAILDVGYEDLVSNFEAQARRIVDFCGLPWDEACLSFHKTQRPIRTASAAQVRQPLYNTSVARWRAIDPALLAPLREALGDQDSDLS